MRYRLQQLACLIGLVTALGVAAPAEDTNVVVRFADLDRTITYRGLTRTAAHDLDQACRAQRAVYEQAKRLAVREWESDPANGKFPAGNLSPRTVMPGGTFRDGAAANAEIATRSRSLTPPAATAGPQAERIKQAAAMLDKHLTALAGPAAAMGDASAPQDQAWQAELLARHNAARQKEGKPPLKINAKLAAAAQKYAEFLLRTGKFGHQENGTPADRVTAEGYGFMAVGENIAKGQDTPQAVVDGWMNSPGHRRNILGDFKDVGFGRAGNAGDPVWVTNFGTSR